MNLQDACRIELLVELPGLGLIERALREAGAPVWTVLPAFRGRTPLGEWSREGQVGGAGNWMMVVCTIPAAEGEALARTLQDAAGGLLGALSMVPCRMALGTGG